MGSYTVEQVEFLRQRADISYEEALEVLERCNGDLTRCLVDLERRGRVRKGQGASAGQGTQYTSQGAQRGYASRSTVSNWLRKLTVMRLVVAKGERVYVDIPVWYPLLMLLVAPHLFIMTIIGMFIFGLKIRFDNGTGQQVGDERFYDIVDKAADNIKSTVSDFARAARETTKKAQRSEVENNTPYSAPAHTEEKPQSNPAEVEVDIPDVKAYEEFTGDDDENEFTVG